MTAVYIPPDANTSVALTQLHTTVNKHQWNHPDGVHIIAGDFNQTCLKTVLPKFTQYVKFATRGKNTLDHVYSNIKSAYMAVSLPHLGKSDHSSLLLLTAYTPLRRKSKLITKIIKKWPEGALEQLQDCFEQMDWEVFEYQDLEQYTETVLFYIKVCMDNVSLIKKIQVFPNRKPWMTYEVQSLLKECNSTYRSGDKALYSAARANFEKRYQTCQRVL